MSVQVGIARANVAAENGIRLWAAAGARVAPTGLLQLETYQWAAGPGFFFLVTSVIGVYMLMAELSLSAIPAWGSVLFSNVPKCKWLSSDFKG